MKDKKIIIALDDEGERKIEIDPEIKYSSFELEEMTNEILKAHCKAIDPETGKPNGLQGLLFEEHLYSRRRREIYNINGVPDPSIVSGMYWRSHPQGRKVNSNEARKGNGASYYR